MKTGIMGYGIKVPKHRLKCEEIVKVEVVSLKMLLMTQSIEEILEKRMSKKFEICYISETNLKQ